MIGHRFGHQSAQLKYSGLVFTARLQSFAFPKCFSCVFFRYEWLAEEELGEAVEATEAQGGTRFLEPPWKLVLSNKALLAVMWCVLFY